MIFSTVSGKFRRPGKRLGIDVQGRTRVVHLDQIGRCRLYGGLWLCAAVILGWRSLPYLGWVFDGQITPLQGDGPYYAVVLGIGIGWVKGRTVLRRSADRNIQRLWNISERAPITAIFNVSVLVLLGGMMALGVVLRHAPYDPSVKAWVIGITYPAVTVALGMGGIRIIGGLREKEQVDRQCNGMPWIRSHFRT